MKLRTTLILAGIALGLGLFIFALDQRNPSRRALEGRSSNVVDIDPQAVVHVQIQNGDSTVDLRRAGEGWTMTMPVQDRADAEVIEQLIEDVRLLRHQGELADLGRGSEKKQRLRDFGLLKPRLRLRLDGPGHAWELNFGNDTAVTGSTYLRVQGKEPVYVVADSLKELITRKPDDFRDHRLTPFLTAQIDRAELHLSGGLMVLQRTQDDWEMERPIKGRASNERVTALLRKVNGATIRDFVDLNGGALGDLGSQTIGLTLGSGDQQVELTFGGATSPGKRLVTISGRPKAFLVDASVPQALEVPPNDLRDRRIARFNPDLIDRITIDSGSQAFALARHEDEWRFADNHRAANPEAVSRLIQKVTAEDINAFVSDAAADLDRYGLEQPRCTITFSSYATENTAESYAGETPVCTLLLGKGENGSTYARLAEEPYVFNIADSALSTWPMSRQEFQSLDLFAFRRSDLAEVEIETPGRAPITLSRDSSGHWRKGGQNDPGNDAAIQIFLNTLVSLRAENWLASDQCPPPVLTITLRFRDLPSGQTVTLKLGPAAKGGAHEGSVSNLSGVFRLGSREFAELERGLGT